MPARRRFFAAATVLSLTLGAVHASAVPIAGGWTANQPGGVTYGAVTGTGTSADSWTFALNLESTVGTTTTGARSHAGSRREQWVLR